MKAPLTVEQAKTSKQRLLFEVFPEKLFKSDPNYVPPVPGTVIKVLDPKSHFFKNGQVAGFLAYRGQEIVGRIAAMTNLRYNQYHQDKTGFFGLFDFAEDIEVAQALLDKAREWLRGQGCDRYRGPMNNPMGDEIGLLTQGFDSPPFILMPYNPTYYLEIYEKLGLQPVKDLAAYYMAAEGLPPERVVRIVDRIKKHSGVKVRSVDMKNLKRELGIIQDLYNETLSRNYGFVPLSPEDLDLFASEFKHIVDPKMVMIAEKDGKPIGFSLAFPDINEFLVPLKKSARWLRLIQFFWKIKTQSPKQARLAVIGVRKEFLHLGLGALFYFETLERSKRSYIGGEMSWVEEDNKEIIRGIELMGGKQYKSYRVYENALV